MAEKICEICGKEFNAKGRDRVCGDCRGHTKCCVCGKEVVFKGNQLAEYKRRGWITCSNKCGQEKRRRDAGGGYADGSVLQISNAGTDTYVWRRK